MRSVTTIHFGFGPSANGSLASRNSPTVSPWSRLLEMSFLSDAHTISLNGVCTWGELHIQFSLGETFFDLSTIAIRWFHNDRRSRR